MIPQEFVVMYLVANAVGLGLLELGYWMPRVARWAWVAIFVWAAAVNTFTAAVEPWVYLAYGGLTPSEWYEGFIGGWFSRLVSPVKAYMRIPAWTGWGYSKDLPRTGISGVGRPTLLEVIAPADLRPIGSLQADRPVQDLYLDALQLSFPVYPDGAVTVRLPLEKSDRSMIPIELAITYMACSDTTCLPPVENKRISATLRNQ